MSERQPRRPDAPQGAPAGGRPGAPGGPSFPADRQTNLLTGGRLKVVAFLGLLIFVVVVGLVAYFAWVNIAYVDTLHAHIDGTIVQVRAPVAGRIAEAPLEVGDAVAQHEDLVVVETFNAAAASGASRLLVPVKAPIAGVVTEKAARVGDIVSAGQVVATLVDPDALWVTASVHESRIPQVRVGQSAHIWINTRTVRRDFWGRVEQVGRVTNTTLAAGRGVVSSAPSPAEVPIRISIDPDGYELYAGMTAEVRIRLSPRGW
jgi:multidrug resistance efflux pump